MGLLLGAILCCATSISWFSIEIVRLRNLRVTLVPSSDPVALLAFRSVMFRRSHRLAPPFLVFMLGISLLYHAGLQVTADAAPEARKWAADKKSDVDRQLLAVGTIVAFVYIIRRRVILHSTPH